MGKCKYRVTLEKCCDRFAIVKGGCHKTFSKRCMKTFHIDGSGISQIKSHAKCHKEDSKQLKFRIETQTAVLQKNLKLT